MELFVFNRDLNMIGIIGTYTSLIWNRRYSKHGDFELHCPLNTENLELLTKENIIYKNDDEEAGYIQYRNLAMNEGGDEVLVVRGKFLTGYLNRRIIWGTKTLDMTTEMAIRELTTENAINPSDADRIIPLLALGEARGYTQTANTQTSYVNLLDKIESLASDAEMGIKTRLDIENKRLIFELYEGLNRTAGQNINPPAIFSKEFENVLEQEYTDSSLGYSNVALVAGEGEGTNRKRVTVGGGAGMDRYEVHVDARDLQSTKEDGTPIPEAKYLDMLRDRGNSKLEESKEIQTFDSKINLNSNLTYKKDFDLGDIVTCTSKKWGITIDTRITEVQEIYESTGKQINVTFGDSIPTLIEKLKEVIS